MRNDILKVKVVGHRTVQLILEREALRFLSFLVEVVGSLYVVEGVVE